MNRLALFLLPAVLASCSTAPLQPMRTAEGQAKLQELLTGRVAGQPITCLPFNRGDNMTIIDEGTVIFGSGNTVYRNDFNGSVCDGLGSNLYALRTRSSGSGPCRGDIVEVINKSTGMTAGSCVYGDFVPYTRP